MFSAAVSISLARAVSAMSGDQLKLNAISFVSRVAEIAQHLHVLERPVLRMATALPGAEMLVETHLRRTLC